MKFKLGEHILVIGKTGSGKTVFMRDNIVCLYPRFIIFALDDKDSWSKISDVTVTTVKEVSYALGNHNKIFFMYDYENEEKLIEDWDNICSIVLENGNMAIVNDEIEDVCGISMITNNHSKILRKGRRENVTHIVATKRPQNIPKLVYTQTTHFFIFNLSDYDILKVGEYLNGLENIRNLKNYECLYFCNEKLEKIVVSEKRLEG